MELSEILNSLSSSPSVEKTASTSLSSAIDNALNSGMDKTASYTNSSPTEDLIKIAQDISNAEQDALIKEAHIYGMAVADGFASRMSAYGQPTDYVKTASFDTDTIKEAMELGYAHASAALANNSYAYTGTEKTAADLEYIKTASYYQGQEQAVKLASYLQGQELAAKVASNLTKIASNYEEFGFKVGNSILKRLAS